MERVNVTQQVIRGTCLVYIYLSILYLTLKICLETKPKL